MRQKLINYIEGLFAEAPNTVRAREYKEEILQNNLEKLDELISGGMRDEDAYKTVLAGIGDMTDFFQALKEDEAETDKKSNNTVSTDRVDKNKKKRGVSAVGWVFIGLAGLIATAITLVFVLNAQIVGFKRASHNNKDGAQTINEQRERSFEAQDISQINVSWGSGRIHIKRNDADNVMIRETGSAELPMKASLTDGTLDIAYTQNKMLGLFDMFSDKSIEILIPEGMSADAIKVESASGDVLVSSDAFSNADINTASGRVVVEEGSFETLRVHTSSGSISVSADAENAVLGSSSGRVELALSSAAKSVSVETSSGSVALLLKQGAGGKISYESSSGRLSSALPVIMNGDAYQIGDGQTAVSVETSSGSLYIKDV